MLTLLLLLYVKFLRHSPWFYAESEYLGANRSGASPIISGCLIVRVKPFTSGPLPPFTVFECPQDTQITSLTNDVARIFIDPSDQPSFTQTLNQYIQSLLQQSDLQYGLVIQTWQLNSWPEKLTLVKEKPYQCNVLHSWFKLGFYAIMLNHWIIALIYKQISKLWSRSVPLG